MAASLIVACVVMLAMTAFMAVAIKQITVTLKRQLREDAAVVMGTYDSLMEKKSRQLRALNRELAKARKNAAQTEPKPAAAQSPAVSQTNPIEGIGMMAGVRWKPKDLGSMYRAIHQGFRLDYDQILNQAGRGAKETVPSPAQQLLDSLSFDTFCSLATLPGEKQYEILDSALSGKQKQLLLEYTAGEPSVQSVAFYSYLKALAKEQDSRIAVRVAQGVNLDRIPDGVTAEFSPDLCEGIQIVAGGLLYDYSITERELN